MSTSANAKVNVIILTGFLGAGKTTLLNRILTAQHGRRIAVIVNEFGEVGIDHHLLISSDQQVVQMNNGCICCTVRGDLLRALFDLMERRDQFDTIVIETTGLAEPAPIVQTLYADERVRSQCTLQGVVTVVDAKHISGQLHDSPEAHEQIAFADLVLLNKIDLSTPEALEQIEREIRQINKVAAIVQTRNSDMNVGEIVDMAHVGADFDVRVAAASHDDHVHDEHCHDEHCHDEHCHDENCDHPDHAHGQDHHHDHRHHAHGHLRHIQTVCIFQPGPLDGLKVGTWFRLLTEKYGAKILRMKGILDLWGDPDEFLFQGVQNELECKPGKVWPEGVEHINRLVFIGRDLDESAIRSGFKECLLKEGDVLPDKPDPFGRWHVEISSHRLDQIRYWMRQNFQYTADIPIIIKEVPCGKAGCPPIETAILAMLKHEPPRVFKVQKPIDEITFDHIYDLMENPMPCC